MPRRYEQGYATPVTQHEKQGAKPEVWGGGCECWVTPEHTWFRYGGAIEPGSMVEYNPDCPEHGEIAQ